MIRSFLPKVSSACLWIFLLILITSSCSKNRILVSENSGPLVTTSIRPAGPQQNDDAKQEKDDAAGEPVSHQKSGTGHQMPEGEVKQFASKSIFFEFNHWNLNIEAQNLLEKMADLLRRQPDYCLRIDGHCDERGTSVYNLALGERRAQAAKAFLMALDISGNRIAIFSYGEERPEDPRHVPEAWAQNRRDVLTFIQ